MHVLEQQGYRAHEFGWPCDQSEHSLFKKGWMARELQQQRIRDERARIETMRKAS